MVDDPTEVGNVAAPTAPTLSFILDGKPHVHALPAAGPVSIGRGASNDIVIPHTSVSRNHAVLRFGATVTVEDLGSGNGTRVGGTTIAAHTPTVLPGETLVEIGSVLLVLRGLDTPARAPTSTSGRDRPTRSLEEWIELCASSPITVLLLGETGVGKGVIAEAIHAKSARQKHPLLAVNCGALAETLLESELFGHERGAFTGATSDRQGLLEAANKGTFFLDEVGELSLSTQAKLLRALEDREVLRVGGRRPIAIDVRFIAATNRDLMKMVAEGTFRRDLFYRLSAVTIRIPPLRERRTEIPNLVRALLGRLGAPTVTIEPGALAMLQASSWPGNIRELRNVLERALLLGRGGPIESAHVVFDAPAEQHLGGEHDTLKDAVQGFEKARIAEALERASGNQTRAAEILGVSRRTLVRWLAEHKFPRPRKDA